MIYRKENIFTCPGKSTFYNKRLVSFCPSLARFCSTQYVVDLHNHVIMYITVIPTQLVMMSIIFDFPDPAPPGDHNMIDHALTELLMGHEKITMFTFYADMTLYPYLIRPKVIALVPCFPFQP